MKNTKIYFSILFLVVVLGISFVSAGWFSDLITGKATNQQQNLSINAGNQAPQISSISVDTITLTEASTVNVPISFYVFDNDLSGDINVGSASVSFTGPISGSHSGGSCITLANPDTKTKWLGCSVDFSWYDEPGTWTISVSISDNSGGSDTDTSASVTVNSLTAFVASPSALTWAPISAGVVDQSSNNDPMVLNNTGNIALSISVNATDLAGERNSSFSLYANNFSVGISDPACGADVMTNSEYTPITGATLLRGDYTPNDGTAQTPLYFCLKKAGSEIIAQAYSTAKNGRWIVKATA